MKICIILGTRPEVIKLSSIIRECEKRKLEYFVIHTNQHYSENMDKVIFEDLNLPKPRYNLNIGSGNHGDQTGKMLIKIEKILLTENPDIVLVQGDTNTVLAGTLAASKLNIKVGHVEAGLRSYDRTMPEEINRIVTDSISDFLYVPTKNQKKILLSEGINKNKIFITGNTIVDSVIQNLKIAKQKTEILKRMNLKKSKYFLLTLHRPANVDNRDNFKNILGALTLIYKKYSFPIIFPIHPRTKKMMEKFILVPPKGLIIIEPLGYLDFLQLEANAKLILTDSGGIQEESCILKIPSVTLRDNTERPETIDVGANVLVGTNIKKILDGVENMIKSNKTWINPFGKGDTSKKILKYILVKHDEK